MYTKYKTGTCFVNSFTILNSNYRSKIIYFINSNYRSDLIVALKITLPYRFVLIFFLLEKIPNISFVFNCFIFFFQFKKISYIFNYFVFRLFLYIQISWFLYTALHILNMCCFTTILGRVCFEKAHNVAFSNIHHFL